MHINKGISVGPFDMETDSAPSHNRQKILAAKAAGSTNNNNYGLHTTDSYAKQLSTYNNQSPSLNYN